MANSSNNDFFRSQEFVNNLRLFEDAQRAGRSCILGSDELADIAEYYYESGLYGKGKEVAEYATSLYPDASAPLSFLACYYMNTKKDFAKAKEFIDKVADKTTPEYFITLAEYYLHTDNRDKAVQTLRSGEKAIDFEDSNYFALDAAYLLYDYKITDEADKWKDRFEDKDSIDYLKLQARSKSEHGNNTEAIKFLEKVIDKDPFCTDNWILLSSIQLMDDKYSDAATSAEYAIAIDSKQAIAYQNLGNAFFKMCNYKKALDAYEKFAELCDNEVAYLLKARCYFCMQNNKKAYELLMIAKGKCTENFANKADIYKDLAIVCGWGNEPETAFEYINWLKEHGVIDPELNLIEGGVLLSMKKLEQANDVFSKGYELADSKMEYLFQVAVAFYEHSFDTAAYLLLKEIFDKEPKRTRGLAYLAMTCNYLGFEDEFLKYLELATKENPDEAKAVIGELFPKGMAPYDYPEYAKRKMKKG